MLNLLLIKNCLRQHKTVYICVFAVLFLSVFSLAFFSAYADSLAYGELLQALEESNGANIKVRNATKEDVSMFDSLENVTVWYEDGTIYIACDNINSSENVAAKTSEIIRNSKKDLRMLFYTPSWFASYFEEGFVTVIKFIMSAVSLVSIYYIFNVFIGRQHKDFAIYKSVGMSREQFTVIVGIEFFAVFVLAVLLALPAAGLALRLLVSLYFKVKITMSSIGYAVYRFQTKKQIFVLALALLTTMLAYFITLYKYFGSHTLAKSLSRTGNFKRTASSMKKKSIFALLPFLKFARNRTLTVIAVMLILPVFGYAVYEMNYGYEPYVKRNGCDFIISDRYIADVSTLRQEDIDELLGFSCVDRVGYYYYNNNFNEKGTQVLSPTIGRAAFDVIYDDLSVKEGEVYIDEKFSEQYKVGDVIEIVSTETNRELDIKISGTYKTENTQNTPRYLTFYCTMDTFSALTGIETTPRSLFVYLKEDVTEQEHSDIREWLNDTFPNSYSDERQEIEDRRIIIERSKKVDMLRSAAMILTSSVTLWAVLMFEVYSRRDEISVLYSIGAEKRQLKKLLLIEMGMRSAVCSVLIVSVCAVAGAIKNTIPFSFGIFAVYVGAVLVTTANFVIPSMIAFHGIVKNQNKERDNGDTESLGAE